MFWQLVAAAAALGVAYYRWSRRRLYRLAREIPSGVKEYPLVGHAYKFLGSGEDRMNAFQAFGRVANLQGGLSSFWLSHRLFICMTDPNAIEVVSKTCPHKDEFTYKFVRTVLGNCTITAPVNISQPRRKIMAPFFNLKNLNQLVQVFQDKSSITVDLMRVEVEGGDFPLWKYITTYSLDTVFETALGRHMNSQEDPSHFVLRAMDEVTYMLGERMLQPWLHPDFIYKRLPVYKRFHTQRQKCWDLTDEIIQEKRTELKTAESKGVKNTSKGWSSFLDTIIQSSGGVEKGYSDVELREEVMMMVVAGSDTTALGTCFTGVMLSRHPGVQDRVYQELREVFGDSDREVTAQDLPKLKYMDAVIKESLRLYPPAPVMLKEVHDDMVLRVKLVSGTAINVNIWAAHRNPAYWGADAELFRPERFLQGALPHPACFIPFSYPVRNCIGATYAIMSTKIALANLLRRYQLLPPANMAAADLTKPLRLQYCVLMRSVDNFIVRVEERKKTNNLDNI